VPHRKTKALVEQVRPNRSNGPSTRGAFSLMDKQKIDPQNDYNNGEDEVNEVFCSYFHPPKPV
jgi:hypothetical protein